MAGSKFSSEKNLAAKVFSTLSMTIHTKLILSIYNGEWYPDQYQVRRDLTECTPGEKYCFDDSDFI